MTLLLQDDYSCENISKVPREKQCTVIRTHCPSGVLRWPCVQWQSTTSCGHLGHMLFLRHTALPPAMHGANRASNPVSCFARVCSSSRCAALAHTAARALCMSVSVASFGGPELCGSAHAAVRMVHKSTAVTCPLAAALACADSTHAAWFSCCCLHAESLVPYAEWYFCSVAPHHAVLRTIYIVSSGC